VVVDHQILPVSQAIYFEVEDGRMIFAIPRGSKTYIGTTDTNYTGLKDDVYASADDVNYLIKAVNQNFDKINLTPRQVESSWAGLRPLIHEDGKSASELSRKDEIFESDSGLISIAGGKLTGYRKMAERVVDMVVEQRFPNRELNTCTTNKIPLSGNAFKDYKTVVSYRVQVKKQLAPSRLGDQAAYLVSTYGKQTDHILLTARQAGKLTEASLLEAEMQFCLDYEMAILPEDFLIRRTGMLFFNISKLRAVQQTVLEFYRDKMSWDGAEFERQKSAIENQIRRSTLQDEIK
jgi:glycerol-3-phosphate dehydrogenase